jgi:hypothetical protein
MNKLMHELFDIRLAQTERNVLDDKGEKGRVA